MSNAYGQSALVIGSAHVAISQGGPAIVAGSDRTLTFNGATTITIPAGALVVSDPVALDVPALSDLAISLYLPEPVAAVTEHSAGLQTTYISGPGNFAGAPCGGRKHNAVVLLPGRGGGPRAPTGRARL